MATDLGAILFVELLGMTQYPGSPFTGNIYRDLILFFIVPTIFIIMVLYIMSGRVIPDTKFRILLGVGAYLFIIASGYYKTFALLSGPYFIFLIFILGLLGYLARHFRVGGGYGGGHGGGGMGEDNYSGDNPDETTMSDVEKKMRKIQAKLDKETSDHPREVLTKELLRLENKKEWLKRQHTNPNKYR